MSYLNTTDYDGLTYVAEHAIPPLNHWDTMIDAVKQLPEYKHEKSDANFIYTKQMQEYDNNLKQVDINDLLKGEIPTQDKQGDFIDGFRKRLTTFQSPQKSIMMAYGKEWKRKNPRGTDRNFKRAMVKRFPGEIDG